MTHVCVNESVEIRKVIQDKVDWYCNKNSVWPTTDRPIACGEECRPMTEAQFKEYLNKVHHCRDSWRQSIASSRDVSYSVDKYACPDEDPEAAAALVKSVSAMYTEEFRDAMNSTMQTYMEDASKAKPIIGFTLVETRRNTNLGVEAVYEGGPAHQQGIRPGDALLAIGGEKVSTLDDAFRLVAKHCKVGYICMFQYKRGNDVREAPVWLMTTDKQFMGKPFYFDTTTHQKITA